MAKPTMRHTITLPAGTKPRQVKCRVRLVASLTTDAHGYVTGADTVVADVVTKSPNVSGVVDFPSMNPTSGSSVDVITNPSGCVYEIVTTYPSRRVVTEYFTVPDSLPISPATAFWIGDYLASNPDDLPAQVSAGSLITTPRASMLADDTSAQNFIDEAAIAFINEQASIPAARRYAQLTRSSTVLDAPFYGDSVTNGQVTSGLWYQQVWRARMKSATGKPAGGPGWRYANAVLEPRTPNFTAAGGAAPDVNGLANAAMLINYGGSVTLTPAQFDRFIALFCRSGDPNVSLIRITDSVAGIITGAGFDPYDASLGFPAPFIPLTPRKYDKWADSATVLGASATRTLTIECEPHATRRNGFIFNGTQLLDGEGAGDFLAYDGGITSIATAGFNNGTTHHEAFGTAGRKAAIEFIELGLNETDPAVYQAGLITLINSRKSMYPANQPPTFVIITPWPKSGRTRAQNVPYVRAAINAAISTGAAIFRGHDVFDFNTDYWALSVGNVHPNIDAMYVLGNKLAEFTIQLLGITPMPAASSSVTLAGDVSGPSGANAIGAGKVTAAMMAADVLELIRDTIGTAFTAGTKTTVTVNDGGDTISVNVSGLASTDLSDFAEAVDDRVGALMVAGTRTTWSYNDGANTLQVNVSGLVSSDLSDFTEAVQDVVGVMAWGGSGLTLSYNDGANTIVIDVNVDGSTLEVNADTLRVKDGGITNAKRADMAAKTVSMRHTGSTGPPEDTTMPNLLADLSGQAGADFAWNSKALTGVNDLALVGTPTGLATAARLWGGNATGAPASGTWALADYVYDQDGQVWACVTAGTPGTWVRVGMGNQEVSLIMGQLPYSATGWAITAAQLFGSKTRSGSTQNDNIVYPVLLRKGTWSIGHNFKQASTEGIYTFYIDPDTGTPGSTSVGTIDGYSAGSTTNAVASITGITVAQTGLYFLQVGVSTKNASSSGYGYLVSGISMVRTGA